MKPQDKRILVIDDEPDIRLFLATSLKDAGFVVDSASDGDEALEKVRENVPDFITLDLVMPRKSGVRFFRELRRNKAWAEIPVMIISAHMKDDMGQEDFREIMSGHTINGPVAQLEKPVTPHKLAGTIA